MARLPLLSILAAALMLPASAVARSPHQSSRPSPVHGKLTVRGASPRRLAGKLNSGDPTVPALAVAERYWGAVPCAGQVRVLAERAVPSELDPSTDGWVTFDSSLGANDLQAPASTYTQCTITLASWQWPTASAMRRDWNMFCLTVVHEVGHLLGHPHSLVPGSVMAPVFTSESNVPAICRSSRS